MWSGWLSVHMSNTEIDKLTQKSSRRFLFSLLTNWYKHTLKKNNNHYIATLKTKTMVFLREGPKWGDPILFVNSLITNVLPTSHFISDFIQLLIFLSLGKTILVPQKSFMTLRLKLMELTFKHVELLWLSKQSQYCYLDPRT